MHVLIIFPYRIIIIGLTLEPTSSSGLSTGAISGIVIAVAVIILVAVTGRIFWKKYCGNVA